MSLHSCRQMDCVVPSRAPFRNREMLFVVIAVDARSSYGGRRLSLSRYLNRTNGSTSATTQARGTGGTNELMTKEMGWEYLVTLYRQKLPKFPSTIHLMHRSSQLVLVG
jgi:hypothetical protein